MQQRGLTHGLVVSLTLGLALGVRLKNSSPGAPPNLLAPPQAAASTPATPM